MRFRFVFNQTKSIESIGGAFNETLEPRLPPHDYASWRRFSPSETFGTRPLFLYLFEARQNNALEPISLIHKMDARVHFLRTLLHIDFFGLWF